MSEPLPRAAAEPENRSTRTTSVEGTALQDLIAGQAAGHRIIGTINLPVRAPPSSAKEPEPAAPVARRAAARGRQLARAAFFLLTVSGGHRT